MTGAPDDRPLAVLFAVTEDWYFRSHRRALAEVLIASGCRVALATRFNRHAAELAGARFRMHCRTVRAFTPSAAA